MMKDMKACLYVPFVSPCSLCMLEVAFPLVGSIVKESKMPTLRIELPHCVRKAKQPNARNGKSCRG